MNAADVQNAVIPLIKSFIGFPVIEADQVGEIPEGPHVVFKFTVSYTKGVGRPDVRSEEDSTVRGLNRIQSEDYNMTVSFTAVTDIEEESTTAREIAQEVRDWFDFYGYDEMSAAGIVVVSLGDVGDRNSVNDEEDRQGFDSILRVRRELVKSIPWIEKTEITQIQGG